MRMRSSSLPELRSAEERANSSPQLPELGQPVSSELRSAESAEMGVRQLASTPSSLEQGSLSLCSSLTLPSSPSPPLLRSLSRKGSASRVLQESSGSGQGVQSVSSSRERQGLQVARDDRGQAGSSGQAVDDDDRGQEVQVASSGSECEDGEGGGLAWDEAAALTDVLLKQQQGCAVDIPQRAELDFCGDRSSEALHRMDSSGLNKTE